MAATRENILYVGKMVAKGNTAVVCFTPDEINALSDALKELRDLRGGELPSDVDSAWGSIEEVRMDGEQTA